MFPKSVKIELTIERNSHCRQEDGIDKEWCDEKNI